MSDLFVIRKSLLILLLLLLLLLCDVPLSLSTAMMIYDTPAGPEPKTFLSGAPSSSAGDRPLQQQSKVGYHTRHVAMSTLSNPSSRVVAEDVKEQQRHLQVDFTSPVPSRHSSHQLQKGSQVCAYRGEVRTGTQWGAGTDSTISMQFTGIESSSSIFLRSNYTGKIEEKKQQQQQLYFELPDDEASNKFESGSVDVFYLKAKCVTNICKMILYTDDKGWFADWFVESVTFRLVDGAPEEQHTWILNQWLPNSAGSLNVVKDDCS